MPQSLSSVHVHLIFSAKNRESFLDNTEIRDETHAFLAGIAKKLGCPPIIVGGVADHAHLLYLSGRTVSLADCMKELKRVSSIWIKQRDPTLAAFAWQSGYGAFSVSASNVDDVREYIESFARAISGSTKRRTEKNVIFSVLQNQILTAFDFGNTSLCHEISHFVQNLILPNRESITRGAVSRTNIGRFFANTV